MAENAEFSENEGRSVAFRRSASVLKALPHAVRVVNELKDLPCLGEHSLRVIKVRGIFWVQALVRLNGSVAYANAPLFQEILEDGTSSEVESTRQSEPFQAMKVSDCQNPAYNVTYFATLLKNRFFPHL